MRRKPATKREVRGGGEMPAGCIARARYAGASAVRPRARAGGAERTRTRAPAATRSVGSRGRRFARAFVVVAALAVTGSCGGPPRPDAAGTGPEIVEGGVVFRYVDPDAKSVYVAGDFNLWDPRADALADENGDGVWTLFYPLAPGRYAYKFVVDGRRWIPDPSNPDTESDGFGGINSIVRVPAVRGAKSRSVQ